MKRITILIFLCFFIVFTYVCTSVGENTDNSKAAQIFEPMINEIIASLNIDEVAKIYPVAYHEDCVAFFKVTEKTNYGTIISYQLVVYFSPGKWSIKDVLPAQRDLTKLYPEAKHALIAAGYFPK
jgi:hypothetical protein